MVGGGGDRKEEEEVILVGGLDKQRGVPGMVSISARATNHMAGKHPPPLGTVDRVSTREMLKVGEQMGCPHGTKGRLMCRDCRQKNLTSKPSIVSTPP